MAAAPAQDAAPAKPAAAAAPAQGTAAGKPGELEAEALAEAERKGLRSALLNLAGRPDISSRGFSGSELLAALQRSGGLVSAAKRALLEAGA